jgi:uncharacterized protein YggT (Ycf19 family)
VILLHEAIQLYIYVLFIGAVLSWFPARDSRGGLAQTKRVVAQITEPVLRPIRSIMPRPSVGGVGVDFSVWIAIILLTVINNVI